ncbi:MAG: hypothetical protein L6R40_002866 [Gallowayella cf. fulva]|nr:MAG: hypothetical protein L6R40_002866 [Xanthomendoza cf. fulva]
MSVPRLTFLYPPFFKPQIFSGPCPVYRPLRNSSRLQSREAGISTTSRTEQEAYPQRYGPAAEPQLPPPSQPPVPNDLGRDKSLAGAIEKEVKPPAPKQEEKTAAQSPSKKSVSPNEDPKVTRPTEPPIAKQTPKALDASESHPKEPIPPTPSQQASPTAKPLDTVLRRSAPSDSTTPDSQKPPHLQAPPYIHHFDTFTTTLSLQTGGFTPPQSITLMKAVRGLLAHNLALARAGLVSKSDTENETYLFRAACSELRTEISNLRKTSQRTSSTQLSHLTHEVEILGQRLTQESSALKDELKGMLNDRRMAVRMEQQGVEQRIQELNYKITVALNSDSRSEVEGLRWVLARRAVMAIGCMAGTRKPISPVYFLSPHPQISCAFSPSLPRLFSRKEGEKEMNPEFFVCLLIRGGNPFLVLILGSLRYITYKIHVRDQERQIEAEKAKADSRTESSSGGGGGGGGKFTVPSREMSTQTGDGDTEAMDTEAMLANVSQDGSPAYVSLG